ncbi:MAG: SNF2-related protein [Chloroflexota bacterium]
MELTNYHAKYYAHFLTNRRAADNPEKLAGALVDAQVDLNPHQVDAALFAFRSPLSRGALLADEVGLGKTIEAGLVIAQRWAERQRRILVITPSNLRKQWHQELQEKFFLPCFILETKSFDQARKEGSPNPFDCSGVVICSYHFARSKGKEAGRVPWDMVVIDEAHRLRNVYKKSNKIANELRNTLHGVPKLLLTATPLQNSLLELYGLVSFIDEHVFGDLKSFRDQFSDLTNPRTFAALKKRLEPVCQRTLRSQVLPYIRYTQRRPLLQKFTPTDDEWALYELVSDYLQKPELQALPTGQRQLLTLVLRKLLASSTFAIAGALEKMALRLRRRLDAAQSADSLDDDLEGDFEALTELSDEWGEDEGGGGEGLTAVERHALETEIAELDSFYQLAVSIEHNAKGTALLTALQTAFAQAAELGAAPKALIFTESRRTQEYLLRLLSQTEFADGIVLFNGSNSDKKSAGIYREWLGRQQNSDRITGSRTADMRSALVDYFREQGQIMIATEAAAEGINLQFCALVVNYDLPWNPQRIEQRIGRCHRYGQQHDVVVVNFLNQKNAADLRVFELLDEKFRLFAGVFGASDEVLGAVESGVAFEKRIADIYQTCRTTTEIQAAFDQLQAELSSQIQSAMLNARRTLLENFDDEVKEKLRLRDEQTKAHLNQYEQLLMRLTRHELAGNARFLSDASFDLHTPPVDGVVGGRYELPRRSGEAHYYRLAHPLARYVLQRGEAYETPTAVLSFNYTQAPNKISFLEQLAVKSGWLSLSRLTVESLSQTEDHLIWVWQDDNGRFLDPTDCHRLFTLPATITPTSDSPPAALTHQTTAAQEAILRQISQRNAALFEAEISKLEAWADDRKIALEREIKEYDQRIAEARRAALAAQTLEGKLAAQKEVKALEKERSTRRRTLFDAQDEIDAQRDHIIAETESHLHQSHTLSELFTIRWQID